MNPSMALSDFGNQAEAYTLFSAKLLSSILFALLFFPSCNTFHPHRSRLNTFGTCHALFSTVVFKKLLFPGHIFLSCVSFKFCKTKKLTFFRKPSLIFIIFICATSGWLYEQRVEANAEVGRGRGISTKGGCFQTTVDNVLD